MENNDTQQISVHRAVVEGRAVRYRVTGSGEPVVLVHGLSGSSLWWRNNVPALSQTYRLYLVDLPGFGSMAFPRKRFQLDSAAHWLLHWMEVVGLPQAHFIGHSMGGYLSLWLAAHHPETVSRLVLVAPAVKPEVRSVPGYIRPLMIALRQVNPRFLPILAYDTLRAGLVTIWRTANDLLSVDVQEDLSLISTPTLVVWGENDTLVSPSTGTFLVDQLQSASLLLLKHCGHVCMFEQPEQFNSAVLTFLQHGQYGQ